MNTAGLPFPGRPSPPSAADSPDFDLDDLVFRELLSGHGDLSADSPSRGASGDAAADAARAVALAAVKAAAEIRRATDRASAEPSGRRALRFRDDDPPRLPGQVVFQGAAGRTNLPSARAQAAIPYTRPFTARPDRPSRGLSWDSASDDGAQPANRSGRRWAWVLVASLALLVVIMGGWARPRPDALPTVAPVRVAADEKLIKAGRVFAALPEIERTVRDFYGATAAREKATFIRNGGRLLPVLERYYASHEVERPIESIRRETVNWFSTPSGLFAYGLTVDVDGAPHQFTVELLPEGPRIDWQALTGWTGSDWEAALAEAGTKPATLCVSMVPDTLFAGKFGDREKWIGFRIESPDRRDVAWAYLRRDSGAVQRLPEAFRPERADALNEVVNRTGRPLLPPRRMTLEVRRTDAGSGATVPMVEIIDIRRQGWADIADDAGDPNRESGRAPDFQRSRRPVLQAGRLIAGSVERRFFPIGEGAVRTEPASVEVEFEALVPPGSRVLLGFPDSPGRTVAQGAVTVE